ncbi:MAG: CDP-alcohol phosphatidyltransferase family protein [Thermoplasmata archaeon]|nr:CDP-alcohol phosphatidyltransferase family protein [Thermoplasmata archaeon]
MVLNRYRGKVDSLLGPIAKAFSGISPNALSIISLLCAAVFFTVMIILDDPVELLIGFVLILLNGFFDAIDGKVAKITGKISPRGDLVDHAIDRVADFLIIAGISLSGFADLRIGIIALGTIMIASYMGTQSQALGLQRDYGGILGRAERILLLMIFVILQYLFEVYYQGSFEISSGLSITLLDLLLIIFIIASTVTATQRFVRAWRGLGP